MATLAFSAFGTSWQEVLGLLGGDAFSASDAAKRRVTVSAGSTTTAVNVASTTGFVAGVKVNINTGTFPPEGETKTITIVTDATTLGFADDAWSTAPANGDVLQDGPEQIETILERLEGYIESRLPGIYARMLRRIDGEVLAEYAQDSPTAFTLTLATADASGAGTQWANRDNGTVFLFLNLRGQWADRWGWEENDSRYSVSGQTLTINTALSDGDRLIVQYDYAMTAAAAPKALGRIIRRLAAAEVAELIGLGQEPTRGEYTDELQSRAEEELTRIADGGQTIPEFEKLILYEDTKRSTGVTSGSLSRV